MTRPGTAAINLADSRKRAVTFDIKRKPKNAFDSLMQRIGIQSPKRRFVAGPVTGRNAKRIAVLLEGIQLEQPKPDEIQKGSIQATGSHIETLAQIVAIGVTNSRRMPPDSLAAFLLDSLSSQELSQLFEIVLMQINLPAVLSALMLGKGMNIVEDPAVTEGATTGESGQDAEPDNDNGFPDLNHYAE